MSAPVKVQKTAEGWGFTCTFCAYVSVTTAGFEVAYSNAVRHQHFRVAPSGVRRSDLLALAAAEARTEAKAS